MADRKISDLTALTTPASGDYLPIVDISEASAANKNKRITIEELLRGAPDGTAGAPGFAFESDPDSGLYSTGANGVALSTGGTGRLFVDASGNVGLGATPSGRLHIGGVSSAIVFNKNGSGTDNALLYDNSVATNDLFLGRDSSNVIIRSAGTEKVRITSTGQLSHIGAGSSGSPAVSFNGSAPSNSLVIDSSGRLLVGTSTSTGNIREGQLFSVTAQNSGYGGMSLSCYNSGSVAPILDFNTSASSSSGNYAAVASGRWLGLIVFRGADGTKFIEGAAISAVVDGGVSTNDLPTRLVFSTTADGASSPTEQLRITSDRYVRLASGTGGIQFNGDTAAANALDDYEEGTFTPQLEFGTATTGITYNARQGYYLKIGKIVFTTVYFNLSSKGTATGNATVTGLPFTAEDFNISGTTSWPGSTPSRRQNQTATNFVMTVQDNTATVAITDGAGSSLTDTTFTNGTIIECAFSYRAAA